jgi:hypothetical protein
VEDQPIEERLRLARMASGQDLAAIASRTGVREPLLRAIDQGRFSDLPAGIYGRTAVRSYAKAVGLDPDEIVAACEPLLTIQEDLVAGLARVRGLRPAPTPKPTPLAQATRPIDAVTGPTPFPPWKPVAAVALDGAVIAGLLVIAVGATIPMAGGDAASLGRAAAPVFALMGLLLASCYFVFFGGIACSTAGEKLVGMRVGRRNPQRVDPRAVLARALRCAGRDVRYIVRLGSWAGAVMSSGSSGTSSEPTPSIGHAAGN